MVVKSGKKKPGGVKRPLGEISFEMVLLPLFEPLFLPPGPGGLAPPPPGATPGPGRGGVSPHLFPQRPKAGPGPAPTLPGGVFPRPPRGPFGASFPPAHPIIMVDGGGPGGEGKDSPEEWGCFPGAEIQNR